MLKNSICFVVLVTAVTIAAKSLPKYIKTCSESDPDLDECIKNQANEVIPLIAHGDRKFRIPDLDPVRIERIETKIGRLNILLTDIEVYGLDKATVEDVEYKKDQSRLYIKIFAPEVVLKSTYTMNGQLILIPLEGTGHLEIKLGGANFYDTLVFENFQRDATENIKFLESELDYKFKTTHFQFDNLFNGNKQLGDNVNRLLNEHTEAIDRDFKPIFLDTINVVVKSIVTNMFNGYHYSDMFSP